MNRIPAVFGGWLMGLVLMVLAPVAAGLQGGAGAGQVAEVTPYPRSWSGPPGMKFFGRGLRDATAQTGAWQPRLTAMADGGFVLAGTVRGSGGREAWIARYNPLGLSVWTQVLAGPFDLQVQALGSLPNGGILLAGDLGPARPGFLIALDAGGEILWSRTTSAPETSGVSDRVLGLEVDVTGMGLAVGQFVRADGTEVGLLASVPADGSPGWRLEATEARSALTAISDGEGWLVAGASGEPAQSAWLAHVNATGRIDWQRTYGLAGSGAVMVMDRLANGAILLAGYPDAGGEVWVRQVDGRGEILSEGLLKPGSDGLPWVRSLLGLALTDDGGYWLGGETLGNDAWLARLSPAGEPLWVRTYGSEGADLFSALLPHQGGVLAAGLSVPGQVPGAQSLWLATLDARGEPLVAPTFSDRAAKILALIQAGLGPQSGLAAGGDLEVREGTDGTLSLRLPFARLKGPSADAEGQALDLGTLALLARPPETGAGPWRFSLDGPATLWLPGRAAGQSARLSMARRHFLLELDPNSGLTTALDFQLEGVDLRLDLQNPLAGIEKALGIGDEKLPSGVEATALASLGLGKFNLTVQLTPDAAGRWGGSLRLKLSDLAVRDGQGQELGHLGGWRLDADYADMDLDALEALSGQMEGLNPEEPAAMLAEIATLVEGYLRASGQAKGEWLLTDLAMPLDGGGESLHLGELGLAGSVTPPLDRPLARDLRLQYHLKGLDMVAEASHVALGEARFEIAAERLALANLVEAVLFALQNPATGPAALPDWLPRILGSLEITLASNGFRATLPEEPPLAIEDIKLHLALSGLDSQVPVLAMAYFQDGVSGLDPVLPPWAPRTVKFDLALSGLPLAELLALSLQGEPDPLAALNLLGAQPVQLDIKDIQVVLPAGGLRVRGQAQAQVPARPNALPEGSLTANIELRNLDALARLLDETADPTDRKNLATLVAFLRLVGIERPGAEGTQVLSFALEANSRGEVVVNGKDLTPLLKNSASPISDLHR